MTSQPDVIAKPADWFQNGFHRFLHSYLRRNFHAIAIDRETRLREQFAAASSDQAAPQDDESLPLIVYSNHASWWDPLLAHFINERLLAPRQFYAPIDAEALQQYKVFEKLGFFGVQADSKQGAVQFLKTTEALFQRPHSALWITPEGRFADPRDHSAELMPGLSHLCSKLDRGWVIPLAMEYVFWDERLPMVLFRFGEVVAIPDASDWDKPRWSQELTTRLRTSQQRLAELSMARSSDPFENLLRGKRGASGLYDVARRLKAFASGKSFQASHGDQFE
ncbi:lysophospholipid acyltransferase family protein [Rhodopirellula halodulae]|uniref:lysophospholipid acyltransferase family protein n=1 Tax=Rhodopirellula halodulae TaxID=2894198 RepID=UPI001E5FB18B|nr:lysophospholipid acyltransferase family protein [Rhodopirellula sp. JC737]MCC9656014.1 lysophospholipid acyltransferase family protein [Rhodopirellula sp. JC737]